MPCSTSTGEQYFPAVRAVKGSSGQFKKPWLSVQNLRVKLIGGNESDAVQRVSLSLLEVTGSTIVNHQFTIGRIQGFFQSDFQAIEELGVILSPLDGRG